MGLLQTLAKNKRAASASGRIAVYDTPTAPPRLVKLEAPSWPNLIERLATAAYRECQQKGLSFPYIVLREVVENLIHADFKEVVVSILADGQTVRISDQGPGIVNKEMAFEPGFTTATAKMKHFIRGVGSGLPVVKEVMTFSGGKVEIKDNLGPGTVISLRLTGNRATQAAPHLGVSRRQVSMLSLITELASAGPSEISKELGLTLSTVHRELICLEEVGLLKSNGQGKRFATSEGLKYLNRTVSAGDFK